MDDLFAVAVDTGPDALVKVRLDGEIDQLAIPSLKAGLVEAWGHHPEALVIDLTGVSYLTVSAVGPLLQACLIGRRDGVLVRLLSDSRSVRRLLHLAGAGEALEPPAHRRESLPPAVARFANASADPCG